MNPFSGGDFKLASSPTDNAGIGMGSGVELTD